MNGRVTVLLLALISFACENRSPSITAAVGPSSTASPIQTFTVSGTVMERSAQGERQPAASIKVSYYSGSSTACGGMPVARVSTGLDGRYQFAVPRGGGCVEAQLRTEGDWDYGYSPRKFVVVEGDIVVDFDLEP